MQSTIGGTDPGQPSVGAGGFGFGGGATGFNDPLGNLAPGGQPSDPPNPDPTQGNDFGDRNQPGGFAGSEVGPIVLDLSGQGINVTQLTSSNQFVVGEDNYQHRTAWAGAGSAVLFVDPNGDNAIRNADQYVFSDWDPSASSDMQALEDVFDTNHDGKLDAGDAAFGTFKLMVTNADGTTSVETLAEAGITSIDLEANSVTRDYADGSSIDGETTYTKADGSTGTAATVTFEQVAAGTVLETPLITVNPDGSTTIDNATLHSDGSLATETISTTSADGLTKTIAFDDAGNGIIDRRQTDDTVVGADGSKTETVSDFNGSGVLEDRTATTTSADGRSLTIARDLDGDGVTDQSETRVTGADGATIDGDNGRSASVSATGLALPRRSGVTLARRHLRPRRGQHVETSGIACNRTGRRRPPPGTGQDQVSMLQIRGEESSRAYRCNGW